MEEIRKIANDLLFGQNAPKYPTHHALTRLFEIPGVSEVMQAGEGDAMKLRTILVNKAGLAPEAADHFLNRYKDSLSAYARRIDALGAERTRLEQVPGGVADKAQTIIAPNAGQNHVYPTRSNPDFNYQYDRTLYPGESARIPENYRPILINDAPMRANAKPGPDFHSTQGDIYSTTQGMAKNTRSQVTELAHEGNQVGYIRQTPHGTQTTYVGDMASDQFAKDLQDVSDSYASRNYRNGRAYPKKTLPLGKVGKFLNAIPLAGVLEPLIDIAITPVELGAANLYDENGRVKPGSGFTEPTPKRINSIQEYNPLFGGQIKPQRKSLYNWNNFE